MIAAIEKAQSLAKFASASGCPLSSFALVLSQPEAMELMEQLVKDNPFNPLLHEDARIARAKADPFLVLQHFQCEGLDIMRAELVLN